MIALMIAVFMTTGCNNSGSNGAGFEATTFSFQEEEDGDWGIMDFNGKTLVKPKYSGCPTSIINGMFSVYSDEEQTYTLYSLEDDKPRKIGTYRDIGAFTGQYCPVVDKNGNVKYIDKEGKSPFDIKKIKGHKVVGAYNFFSGLAMIKLDNGKWGYINEDGEIAVPFKYADAWNFNNGLAIVYLETPEDNQNAKWAVIDTEGKELFTKKFRDMTPANFKIEGDVIETTVEYEKFTFIDREGKTIKKVKDNIAPQYIYNGLYVTYNKDTELMGMATIEGKTVLKDKYETVLYNGKLIAAKAENGRWYMMNNKGEKLCRLPGEDIIMFEPEYTNSDRVLLAGEYSKGFVLVNNEGKEIKTEDEIYSASYSYYWGVSLPDDDIEYEGDGDVDYDYETEAVEMDSLAEE